MNDLQTLKRVIEDTSQDNDFDDAIVNDWVQGQNMLRVNIDRGQASVSIYKFFSLVVFRSESRY